MNALDNTVLELGRLMGMEQLRLSPTGHVVLTIDHVGRLAVEPAGPGGDAVLITLTRTLPSGSDSEFHALLALTHYRARAVPGLRVGAIRNDLVLAVLLEPAEATVSRIYEAIQSLDEQHNAIGSTA